jgi:benzoylformate decarboxylase
VEALVALLDSAERPAVVVGAGADEQRAWDALAELAERLDAPVWQEAFTARAGFPQDHPRFAGHLPSDRPRLREVLEPFDVVVVLGAPAFRQYAFAPGPFYGPGTRVAVVTDDPDEAHRSAAELVVLAPVGPTCEALAARVAARERTSSGALLERPSAPAATDGPLTSAHVFSALAQRLPRDAIVFEEAPSSKPELHARIAARAPLGFLSPANGGLGFAIPAAIGVRMALPERPVVAIVGDGSSLYAIQALWSAAHYGVGAVFVVLANGGYAVMDRLAELHGGAAVWPSFPDVDLSGIARSFGCPARRVTTLDELEATFDEIVPGLAGRGEPLLLEVVVAPDSHFVP